MLIVDSSSVATSMSFSVNSSGCDVRISRLGSLLVIGALLRFNKVIPHSSSCKLDCLKIGFSSPSKPFGKHLMVANGLSTKFIKL